MSLAHLLRTPPGHIRSRLFRDLILLVLLTVGLLAAVNWLLIGEFKRKLAASQIAGAATLVRDEVRVLLAPVEQQLLIMRDGLKTAQLTPAAQQALDARFAPTMRHMDQIAGVIYADGAGAEYFLLRDDPHWLTRARAPGNPGAVTWTRWDDAGAVLETRKDSLEYDPRDRPWYQSAVTAAGDRVTWSAPYVFRSLQVPGVTASVAWSEEGTAAVLAVDVTLARILDAIERLPLDRGGRGFLVSSEGGVYVPRGDAEPSRGNHFFSAEKHLGGPLLFDAVAAWQQAGRPENVPLRFSSQGEDWWAGFLPLSEAADAAWVGVALPVRETIGILQSRWHILASTALVIIALCIGLVLLLMRKYSRQLRDLPKLSIEHGDHERDIYALIGSGEDTHLELKSTMRTNLHTGKPGKEIELAWLKGIAAFMNTEGGILLIGVADDGRIVGLEADRFESEDKCRLHFKNLLNQHLGAEYARFLRFDIYDLEGRQIAAVECERANTPVFLRNKNHESFLIRNGPSNIELSISRTLTYVRGRF